MNTTVEKKSVSAGTSGGMSERELFQTVLQHCLLIILGPICSFFLVKNFFFDGVLELDSLSSNLYSAFVAVIILHLALANFIYRAYFSTEVIPGFDKLEKED